MTITRCDRCFKDIPHKSEIYIVEGNRLYRHDEPTYRLELCDRCFKLWLDWVDQEVKK